VNGNWPKQKTENENGEHGPNSDIAYTPGAPLMSYQYMENAGAAADYLPLRFTMGLAMCPYKRLKSMAMVVVVVCRRSRQTANDGHMLRCC